MTILEEIRKFFKNLSYGMYLLLGLTAFFFSCGFEHARIYEHTYPVPSLSGDSLSVQVFKKIQHDFLPTDVELIVTNPMSAFVAQMLISLACAFVVSSPVFMFGIMRYLTPALFRHERRLIFQLIFPCLVLFYAGCAFAYVYLIPATFRILYPYTTSIGATPFFSVNEFVSSVLGLMISTGIVFLLPVFMVVLTFAGFVTSHAWRRHWRHAALIFVIFSAVITPDGTGVTMALLFLPMASLYLVGYLLTARMDRVRIREKLVDESLL